MNVPDSADALGHLSRVGTGHSELEHRERHLLGLGLEGRVAVAGQQRPLRDHLTDGAGVDSQLGHVQVNTATGSSSRLITGLQFTGSV